MTKRTNIMNPLRVTIILSSSKYYSIFTLGISKSFQALFRSKFDERNEDVAMELK